MMLVLISIKGKLLRLLVQVVAGNQQCCAALNLLERMDGGNILYHGKKYLT